MEQLSVDYQKERGEMESGDQTSLVIRALCRCAINAINAKSAINSEGSWVFTTEEIKDAVVATANDAEADVDVEKFTSKRIGRTLGKMRLSTSPRPGGRGSRRWIVSIEDLHRWATSYGMNLADFVAYDGSTLADLSFNGTNGADGTNGTGKAEQNASMDEIHIHSEPNQDELSERTAEIADMCGVSDDEARRMAREELNGNQPERILDDEGNEYFF
jgi:hypothetical protein